jgi:pimeloyl-ACP methyl ester carboxylesterase
MSAPGMQAVRSRPAQVSTPFGLQDPRGRAGHPDSIVLDVDGPVHLADFGGFTDGPVVVCVHGLGGSASGWRAFADALRPTCRVLAVDLPGHGRTPGAGRSVTVLEAAAVLESVIRQLGVGPVILVGHSMGAAVSLLVAESAPELVERLLLLAPPLPREGLTFVSRALLPHVALCLWPRLGVLALRRRVARHTLEDYVRARLRLTCASVTELREVVQQLAAELEDAYERGEDPAASFIHAARSVGLLVARRRRYRETLISVRAPVEVIQGGLDRVVRPAGLRHLRTLRPRWRTHLLPEVGHSPHLEAPALVARLLTNCLPVEEATSMRRQYDGARPARGSWASHSTSAAS